MKKKKRAASRRKKDNELGDFLNAGRLNKGFTLAEVGEMLGLKSLQPVWDWENNKGSGIPADMLLRLVQIYELSAAEAYEHLMNFHQRRTSEKVREKFEKARLKISGKLR